MVAVGRLSLGHLLVLGLLPVVAHAQGEDTGEDSAVTVTTTNPPTVTSTTTLPLCLRPEVIQFGCDGDRVSFMFCGPIKLRPGQFVTFETANAHGNATESRLIPLTSAVTSIENDITLHITVDTRVDPDIRFVFRLPAGAVENLKGKGSAPYTSPVYPQSVTYERWQSSEEPGSEASAVAAAGPETGSAEEEGDVGRQAGIYFIVIAVALVFCLMCGLMVYGSIWRAVKDEVEVDEEKAFKKAERRKAQKEAAAAIAGAGAVAEPGAGKPDAKQCIAQEMREDAFWSKLDLMQPPFRIQRLQAWDLSKKHQETGISDNVVTVGLDSLSPRLALPWHGATQQIAGGQAPPAMALEDDPGRVVSRHVTFSQEPNKSSAFGRQKSSRVVPLGGSTTSTPSTTIEDSPSPWQSEEPRAARAGSERHGRRPSGHSMARSYSKPEISHARSGSKLGATGTGHPQRQRPVWASEGHEPSFAGTWPQPAGRRASSQPVAGRLSAQARPEAADEWRLSASGKFVRVRP